MRGKPFQKGDPRCGRPKGAVSLKKVTAAEILAGIDEKAVWHRLTHSKNEDIALRAAQYLTDRRDGKPVAYNEITTNERRLKLDRPESVDTSGPGKTDSPPSPVPETDRVQ